MDWDASELMAAMEDPVVALDDDQRVLISNQASTELFGGDDLEGKQLGELFEADASVADRYADTLAHYADIGGVVDGDLRHFDADHPTIAALLSGSDPTETDPDVGVFVDGDLRYFYLTSPSVPIDAVERVVVFRDVTSLKRREEDLDFLIQVLTRILRHNLRNDLSVIRGYAEAIAEASDRGSMAETILRKSQDLVETSEKARRIEKAIDVEAQTTFALDDLLERCVADVREEHPTAEYSVDVPPVSVYANPELPEALFDTIENGVVYNDAAQPRIEVTGVREGSLATLKIIDNGPGIPEAEIRTFDHRGETSLVHGSGAGLWLLYTTVQKSDGDVSFETDDGTTVRIRLPVNG
jgi:signal transduction histidine kinase